MTDAWLMPGSSVGILDWKLGRWPFVVSEDWVEICINPHRVKGENDPWLTILLYNFWTVRDKKNPLVTFPKYDFSIKQS